MSNIVYVGTYFDKLGRDLPNDKKIGITTDDVSGRQRALSRTKSAIGFVMLRAWKVEMDARDIERTLHSVFKDQRITGEWFMDEDETVMSGVESVMDLLNTVGTSVREMDLDTQDVMDVEERSVNKEKSVVARKNSDKSYRKHFPTKFVGKSLTYGRGGGSTGENREIILEILDVNKYKSNYLDEIFTNISSARLATNIYLTEVLGCGNINSTNRSHWDQMLCTETRMTVDQICQEIEANEGE